MKKLIEVALPLDDINEQAAREKSIRHGHPSTLHLWWARRPLAACRAVLFAQLVNDPSNFYPNRFRSKKAVQDERERLFGIIRALVNWDNVTDERVLEAARAEIRASWEDTCKASGLPKDTPLPAMLDPFSGGCSIPLEAQRLGLEAHGSDLNPVAVTIGKAMIEIPPKFAGRAPVGPLPADEKQSKVKGTQAWTGAAGLAEDVRRYGAWMRAQAMERIGHLYPTVTLPAEHGGGEGTVIAWLWARTVASPDPSLGGAHVPLVSSFWLSTKKGKETWVEPVIHPDGLSYHFEVRTGAPADAAAVDAGTKQGRGANFKCLLSGVPISGDHIKQEGQEGRMSARLMAIVAEGKKGRIYLAPTDEHERIARSAQPDWRPTQEMPINPRWFSPPDYGMKTFGELFTDRQLVALGTFSDLVGEARAQVVEDAKAAGWEDDGVGLEEGGRGATAYGDAVAVYLAFAVDKAADRNTSLCSWEINMDRMRNTFGRQAIPMVWDFAETNIFAGAGGDLDGTVESLKKALKNVPAPTENIKKHTCIQESATKIEIKKKSIISTDPPYYDNIGYADLSDFFYVWLRRSLRGILPSLFGTMLVPKDEELVATPYRHGGKAKAEKFFMEGMTQALKNIAQASHANFPVTIYYAFKQSETKGDVTSSTGWVTFLEAVLSAGLAITGTWPMRTEMANRMVSKDTNALASSIVLVCRRRGEEAEVVSRKEFIGALREVMPEALEAMIVGGAAGVSPIAPVDLAQAAIGPGMGVFSRYGGVENADGSRMTVREALEQINKAIDSYFAEAEGELDEDTRFCVAWFTQHGFEEGAFGDADVLARAKGTSVEGLGQAGVLASRGGKVRLYRPGEYPAGWDPRRDERVPIWEACHQLCRAMQGSEGEAGELLGKMMERAEGARQLAYRLYTLCERKGWAEDARAYNVLVTSWHGVWEVAQASGGEAQGSLL